MRTIDWRRIEEASLNGLQTQRQLFYDGWLLRVSPGKAKRARSVNAHFGSTLPLARKIDYCERVYRERELPALFRITPFVVPAELDETLSQRGYVVYQPTLVQGVRMQAPPPLLAADAEFRALAPRAFVDAVAALQNLTAGQAAAHLERIVELPLATRAVVAFRDGAAIACGQVMLEDDIAGIFSMVTAEGARGQGVASALMSRLLSWAWDHGAAQAYLQVEQDNAAAIAVYAKFGFHTGYTYHYRARPEDAR
jgi:N-acetylglutamate synthase